MRKNFLESFLFLASLLLSFAPIRSEATLAAKELNLVGRTVFEVVVLKPEKDSLTYERPLPLDLIPYAERIDKYRSVGTAFAISPTELASAAHVFSFDRETQYKDFFIRDGEGNVFRIDKILKYSDRRDFVVFTVRDRPAGEFLPTNPTPEMNRKVYAVGNALGEGVVLRDGLYTSATPEEESGEWKWLRFSAAASPGNSGGPLLDEGGAVIGIVLQKSPNENLNIALPISEVLKAKPGTAHVHKKMLYFVDNIPMTAIDTFDREIPLPALYRELQEQVSEATRSFATKLHDRLLTENREHIFPNGKDSLPLLNRHYHENFPRLIVKGSGGTWDAYAPNQTREVELDGDGDISLGAIGNTLLLHVRKPNQIPLESFYGDSKIFLDTILKGLGATRQVGIDKIKIVSAGNAQSQEEHIDAYGRKWLVRTWSIEHDDSRAVAMSLPVPGGAVVMMRGGSTGLSHGHILDLKTLADFVYLSYCGTLGEWREFLALKKSLPEVFSGIDIGFEYGRNISYKSPRLAFSLDQTDLPITEKSDLHVSFGYFVEGTKTVWDVREIAVGEDRSTPTNFKLRRHAKPATEAGEKELIDWEKLVSRKAPYDRISFIDDNSTRIATVSSAAAEATDLTRSGVVYYLGYRKQGSSGQKEMETTLDSFIRKVKLFEELPPAYGLSTRGNEQR